MSACLTYLLFWFWGFAGIHTSGYFLPRLSPKTPARRASTYVRKVPRLRYCARRRRGNLSPLGCGYSILLTATRERILHISYFCASLASHHNANHRVHAYLTCAGGIVVCRKNKDGRGARRRCNSMGARGALPPHPPFWARLPLLPPSCARAALPLVRQLYLWLYLRCLLLLTPRLPWFAGDLHYRLTFHDSLVPSPRRRRAAPILAFLLLRHTRTLAHTPQPGHRAMVHPSVTH